MTLCNIKNNTEHWNHPDLSPIIDASLILYLTSDKTGAYRDDLSDKANIVTENKTTLVPIDGKNMFGVVPLLNGIDSYMKVINSPSINSITNGLTISVWIYKITNQTGYRTIIGQRSGTTSGDKFILLYGSDVNNSYVFSIKGAPSIGGISSIAGLNKWTNITCTYNGFSISMYKNGILVDSINSNVILPIETSDIYIGCGDNGTNGLQEFSNIEIGDILIYNRGLSASEVLTNYKNNSYYNLAYYNI